MNKPVKSPYGIYHFEDWYIIECSKQSYEFLVDYNNSLLSDKCIYSTYDDCFRAARKWMRDHQNDIYSIYP